MLAALLAAGCTGAPEKGDAEAPAPDPEDAPAVLAEASLPPAPGPAAEEPRRTGDTESVDTSRAQWTAGVVEQRRPDLRMTILEEVRVGRNEGFDRVVFQFREAVPGYHLEYVDRPVRQCGSGEPVEIAGDGWLAVRLEPSQAHDDQGRATVQERARSPGLPTIRELRATCDFEGQVEWVLGVASPNRFRVMELEAPPRLVVDVRH